MNIMLVTVLTWLALGLEMGLKSTTVLDQGW